MRGFIMASNHKSSACLLQKFSPHAKLHAMDTVEFKIQGEFIELAQLLKACGLAETGGHAKQVIQNGEVQVNGLIETRRSCKIRPGQTVRFGGNTVKLT